MNKKLGILMSFFLTFFWFMHLWGYDPQTRLDISGKYFTINGTPTYLNGVSYFGAMSIDYENPIIDTFKNKVIQDLNAIQEAGFNWIRINVDWTALFEHNEEGTDKEQIICSLFENEFDNNDNYLRSFWNRRYSFYKERFEFIMEECDKRGIIVDLTIIRLAKTSETDPKEFNATSDEQHENWLHLLCDEIQEKGYKNVYIDVANEVNINDVPKEILKKYFDLCHYHGIICTCSVSWYGDENSLPIFSTILAQGCDFISAHVASDIRQRITDIQRIESEMVSKGLGRKPIHCNEGLRGSYNLLDSPEADYYQDYINTRLGGAAGWCFHNGSRYWIDNDGEHSRFPHFCFCMTNRAHGSLIEQLEYYDGKIVGENYTVYEKKVFDGIGWKPLDFNGILDQNGNDLKPTNYFDISKTDVFIFRKGWNYPITGWKDWNEQIYPEGENYFTAEVWIPPNSKGKYYVQYYIETIGLNENIGDDQVIFDIKVFQNNSPIQTISITKRMVLIAQMVTRVPIFCLELPLQIESKLKFGVEKKFADVTLDLKKVILSSNNPGLLLLRPNGGEIWQVGSNHKILWEKTGGPQDFRLQLSTDDGASWMDICGRTENDGIYEWTVSDTASTACKVRICDPDDGTVLGISENTFTITTEPAPTDLRVLRPQVGEILEFGSQYTITWDGEYDGNIQVVLFRDGVWKPTLTLSVPAAVGHFHWKVGQYSWLCDDPPVAGSGYTIRLADQNDALLGVPSGTFSLTGTPLPIVEITKPAAGESLEMGSEYTITWNKNGYADTVNIFFYAWNEINKCYEYVASIKTGLSNGNGSIGTFLWKVGTYDYGKPITPGSNCKIQIAAAFDNTPLGESGVFSITGSVLKDITVISPNGGESWQAGTQQNITWMQSNLTGNVTIALIGSGGTEQPIDYVPASSLSYRWEIPCTINPGTDYRIRISQGNVKDESDNDFSIIPAPPPTFTITSPNGGETFMTGNSTRITWTGSDLCGNVTPELYKAGVRDSLIGTAEAKSGFLDWTISDELEPGDDYRVRIFQGNAEDYSDSNFSIVKGGEVLTVKIYEGNYSSGTVNSQGNVYYDGLGVLYYRDYGEMHESRGYCSFDTRSIPVNAHVLSVTWYLRGGGVWYSQNFKVDAVSFGLPLSAAAYNGPVLAANISEMEVKLNSWAKTTVNLANYVRKGDYTQFRVRMPEPLFDTDWAGAIYSNSLSNPAYPSYLEVTYQLPAGPPSLTVVSPNGGESWQAGSPHNITWTKMDVDGDVTIDLYRGNVKQYTIGVAAASAGFVPWTIPPNPALGNDYRVRVYCSSCEDYSDGPFAIVAPTFFSVDTPKSSDWIEPWDGWPIAITWRYSPDLQGRTLNIWLLNDQGQWERTIWMNVPIEQGYFDWWLPRSDTGLCGRYFIIKIDVSGGGPAGFSEWFFVHWPSS